MIYELAFKLAANALILIPSVTTSKIFYTTDENASLIYFRASLFVLHTLHSASNQPYNHFCGHQYRLGLYLLGE